MKTKIPVNGKVRSTFTQDHSPLESEFSGPAFVDSAIVDASDAYPLLLPNLVNSLVELAVLLPGEIERGAWLNAYLLAAGMNQIVEDELHPDPLLLGKVAKYLGRMRRPLGAWAAHLAQMTGAVILMMRSWRQQTRRLARWQADLALLVQQLAEIVMELPESYASPRDELTGSSQALVAALESFPERIRGALLRLPSCFRSFDQHPDDLRRLAEKYFQRWPERGFPLAVVGVRTSGSYLAPLLGAALKAAGLQDVQVLTLRPGRRLRLAERSLLRDVIARGGRVLVTDDPPTTGGSLASTARGLESVGVDDERIIFILQLFGLEKSLPQALRAYKAVLLPWKDWSLHDRLRTESVMQTVRALWAPAIQVESIEPLTLPARKWERSHAHARFRVTCRDNQSGRRFERQLSVKGVGLGYFGQHSLAVAQALPDHTPTLYGFRDGLLYREWLAEEDRLVLEDGFGSDAYIQAVSSYTAARSRTLKVAEDVSSRLFGQRPVWEAASNLMSRSFGRAWVLARPALVDPLIKRLLQVRKPAVVDGRMDRERWFVRPEQGGLVKIDFDERDFCNLDLYCYDPVYDLACAALELQDKTLVEKLRLAYTRQTGEEVDDERWLIYSLVHLWDQGRIQARHSDNWRRGFSRAVQDYFSAHYFADLDAAQPGELCALDIDGVLETNLLGFPSLSPSSAMGLRALKQHAYRPVLSTGRSLQDVRERCKAYKLPGGVAEYGAVVYNHLTGETISLLTAHQTATMDRLRAALGEFPGVVLDPDYQFGLRAFRIDERGRRRSLQADTVSKALQRAQVEGRIRSIGGDSQTDFMVSEIDKSSGLRVLERQLDGHTKQKMGAAYAFAMGDTIEDLPMLRLAELAAAPAHAAEALPYPEVKILTRPYQAGMAQAVARLLGHRPGTCSACRGPHLSSNSKLLLRLFAVQESGRAGMVRNALALGLWRFQQVN